MEGKEALIKSSERMKKLLSVKQLSSEELGNLTGSKRGDKIRNVVNMKNGISHTLALLICEKFPDVSYEWLRFGVEPMLLQPDQVKKLPDKETCEMCRIKDAEIEILNKRLIDQEEYFKRQRAGQELFYNGLLEAARKKLEDC